MRFGEILGSAILGIPFYYLWHYLVPIYLPSLPPLYAQIPLLDFVGIFVAVGILRAVIYPGSYCFKFRHHAWKHYGKRHFNDGW